MSDSTPPADGFRPMTVDLPGLARAIEHQRQFVSSALNHLPEQDRAAVAHYLVMTDQFVKATLGKFHDTE